ncbi:UbiA family prenyltransferase [Halococcus dombrowskii]|uniref:UbiA family prenyltransferase n=1 Tax=Halococcus dombrowskii TaxID=179637 RepID=A0AAV3SL40_HALDO|nr:UbiA family prenyltransferase [Halococcus dombrowskii]UOO94237.1 UbiA family prenyltransferase [Halococcus dombrowskii]
MGGSEGAAREADSRGKLAAYAALVRVPNLFSAPPDVLLGGALVAATGTTVSIPALAGLAVASMLLYAGGTTLNDYFDAAIDARERPERPIPSGRIPRRTAGALGAALLIGGVLVALVAAGPRAGLFAAALATVIALYDGVLKGSPAGFLAMGSARGLDVLLGTAAGTTAATAALPAWALAIPVVITLYIAAVTYMADNEATTTERGAVAAAAAGVLLAVLGVLAAVVTTGPSLVRTAFAVGLIGGFLVWTGRALGPAYATPRPDTVGPAVGTCILALVVLDAAFAALAGVEWALAVLVFLVPAVGLSRLFDVS